ncbi:MAG: hypothetical protein HOP15_02120, partial [Planctomycetes bacterium]|nr:hypothetical protein [Planctomycetota bacterium]
MSATTGPTDAAAELSVARGTPGELRPAPVPAERAERARVELLVELLSDESPARA